MQLHACIPMITIALKDTVPLKIFAIHSSLNYGDNTVVTGGYSCKIAIENSGKEIWGTHQPSYMGLTALHQYVISFKTV